MLGIKFFIFAATSEHPVSVKSTADRQAGTYKQLKQLKQQTTDNMYEPKTFYMVVIVMNQAQGVNRSSLTDNWQIGIN